MNRTNLLLSIGIVLMLATGCKDETEPNEDWCLDSEFRVPVKVNIEIDKSFSDYLTIDSTKMDIRQYGRTRSDPSWELQYYVATYEKDGTKPVDVFSSFTNPVDVKVKPGKYKFVGWATYTPPSESRCHYFHLDDFSEIMLKHKYDYEGNDYYKVPYRGDSIHRVSYTTSELNLGLKPAKAKFKLIATD